MKVLAIGERRGGELVDTTYNLITAGKDIAGSEAELELAIVGGGGEEVSKNGVDKIYEIESEDEFNHGVYVQAIEQLYEQIDPDILLMSNSTVGLDYAPAVAESIGLPIVTDVTKFGENHVVKELYGSKVESKVKINEDSYALTVRPTEWGPTEQDADVPIEKFDPDIDDSKIGSEVKGYEEAATGEVDLSEADFIISIGRGIDEEENLGIIEEVCEATGAALGSSRPLVDKGWLPNERQVGQSGKTVKPDIYVAVGISGAVQHVTGMKDSETIIAINNDPSAPIFDIADYGVVADLFDVIPALTEEFE